MYKIRQLEINKLGKTLKNKYRNLTTSQFECCLNGQDPYQISSAKVVALRATEGHLPVGLLLASYYPLLSTVEIYSLFVLETFRHCGIGTGLMKHCLEIAPNLGARYVTIKYSASLKEAPFIVKILEKSGWNPPELFMVKYFYDCYQFRPEWFLKPFELPEGFSIFLWKDLTSVDRLRVQHLVEQRRIESSVNPLLNEELMEPINSLGIRYHGEVVGWMVTHRVDKDTICYAKLFILKEHQQKGSSIMMLIRSIQMQQHSQVQYSLFEINQGQIQPRWQKFVQTKLKPYAQGVEEIYSALCIL